MILVIDPAWSGPTGWLKYDLKTGETDYGTLEAKDAKDPRKRFDLLQGVKTLVIENAFLKRNVKTYGLLERAKMLWTQAAIDHFGLTEEDIINVPPRTWQTCIVRGLRIWDKKDQEAIKYYIWYRYFSGEKVELSDHEVSCFGMLSWYVDRSNMKDKKCLEADF